MSNNYILKFSCPDTKGIVSDVTKFLFDIGGFIIESAQFGDESTNRFFLRAEFQAEKTLEEISNGFKNIADKFAMDFEFFDKNYKPKLLIAVTKASHCLNHLLHKVEVGSLNAEIVGIVSNHKDLEYIANRFGQKFYHLPIEGDKEKQEEKFFKIFEDSKTDLLILARYMQILSEEFSNKLNYRAINIHHSFLPGFKGAKPYHQAHERGVKIIGATAHYVTENLDEGPIIEQDITRVNHQNKPEDLKHIGEDIENRVLLNAVKWHLEHRVIINGNKTVIFN